MNTLKPCPFCGGTKICTEKGINLNYCDNCSAESNIEHWNTRPIEDELRARIAELEEKQHWIPVSERLPEVNGWYLCGMVSFLGKTFTNEIYFDTVNIDPRWNNCTQDRVYCWLDGVPELPEVTE